MTFIQVWKQKLIWDGFIKCCERTVPQSYAVMLQLPPNTLSDFLKSVPKLRDPLLEHVQVKYLAARKNEAKREKCSLGLNFVFKFYLPGHRL